MTALIADQSAEADQGVGLGIEDRLAVLQSAEGFAPYAIGRRDLAHHRLVLVAVGHENRLPIAAQPEQHRPLVGRLHDTHGAPA